MKHMTSVLAMYASFEIFPTLPGRIAHNRDYAGVW